MYCKNCGHKLKRKTKYGYVHGVASRDVITGKFRVCCCAWYAAEHRYCGCIKPEPVEGKK